jgi:predicted dehydrogenase
MPHPLVRDPDNIRLAMLGMVEGNGHPYSWSAILNGRYRPEPIRAAGYDGILDYLGAQPPAALGIPGAEVTHVWCDDPRDAERVQRAIDLPHRLDRAEDAIGRVDAVIIATDKGAEHLDRARPFIEAGLPVFIDKPLTDQVDHLQRFEAWQREGKPILSTSCMRYAHEFATLRERLPEVGEPRLIFGAMMKSWQRYGIHILEAVYPLLEPGGWLAVTNTGRAEGRNIVHLEHASGVEVVLTVIQDLDGGYGSVSVMGTRGRIDAQFADTFYAFKTQLQGFIDLLRTGVPPFAWEQTAEQMRIVIAGIRSREEHGRRVALNEV